MSIYANAVLTGIMLLLVAGCTSVPTVRAYSAPESTKTESFQNYELNQEQIAYIGENIVEKARLVYTEISEGKYKALVTRGKVPFTIRQGQLYSVRYEDADDGGIYVNTDGGSGGVPAGIKVDLNGILLDEHPYYFNVGGWQNHGLVTIGDIGEKLFDPAPTSRKYAPESFKMQIIYLGVSGNDIKASYREYKDDIARPAFYQDLSYNLSDGQNVRYKKFRIKVLDATNEQIKYIVLED